MKRYKASLVFKLFWTMTYIVKANNFQEALKKASKQVFANEDISENIVRFEIKEVKR